LFIIKLRTIQQRPHITFFSGRSRPETLKLETSIYRKNIRNFLKMYVRQRPHFIGESALGLLSFFVF